MSENFNGKKGNKEKSEEPYNSQFRNMGKSNNYSFYYNNNTNNPSLKK